MDRDECARAVARVARERFEAPSPVGEEAVRYAQTALGLWGAAQWTALMADEGDPDREAMAEIVLFPDEGMRLALEPVLAGCAHGAPDADAVARGLAGCEASFVAPEGAQFVVRLDAAQAELVVRRLHVDVAFPTDVLEALAALDGDVCLRARVRLRRARLAWADAVRFVVRTLAERLGGEADFLRLLDWCCLFLESESPRMDESRGPVAHGPAAELTGGDVVLDGLGPLPGAASALPPGAPGLSLALASRHARAVRLLKDHEARTGRWEKSNFETMLLSGDRPPHAEPDALRRDMAASERIRMAVFGLSAAASVLDRDLGGVAEGDALDGIFRLMD